MSAPRADVRPRNIPRPVWLDTCDELVNLHHVARIGQCYSVHHLWNAIFYGADGRILGTRLLRDGQTIKELIGAHESERGGAA